MLAENNSGLVEKEQKLISVAARILASVSVFIASLVAFLLVPVFPTSISVLFAGASGALSYKMPVLSMLLTFFGIVLGFSYQLSLPLSIIFYLSLLLFIIGLTTKDANSAITVSIGILAAMLMISPLYFLAIPLLLAIPLFSSKGRIGNVGAIIVFVALYTPLIVHATSSTSTTPTILSRCQFTPKPALEVINLNFIFFRIGESLPTTASDIGLYLDRFGVFFPTFRSNDVLGRMLGMYLLVLTGVGTTVTKGSLALFHWLGKKRILPAILPWIAPASSLLIGIGTFLSLFATMAPPMQYTNGLKPVFVAIMIATVPAFGAVASVIKGWLHKRYLMNSLLDNRFQQLSDVRQYADLDPEVIEGVVQDRIDVASGWISQAEELFDTRNFFQAKDRYNKVKEYLENTRGLLIRHSSGSEQNKLDELAILSTSNMKICSDAETKNHEPGNIQRISGASESRQPEAGVSTANQISERSSAFNRRPTPPQELAATIDFSNFGQTQTFPPELSNLYYETAFIGRGGFANVFKAKRRADSINVAVKVPINLDAATGRSFLREINSWQLLNHVNIVRLLDYNILPIPYFEMELCEKSLNEIAKPIDIYRAGKIILDVSEGIKLAHARAIFHRDLKPQNILLKGQIPKVSDWGMSKVMPERRDSATHVVSPLYAAPEQISSRKFGQPDHRTDIYQLGVVFYELVTGKTPFSGDNVVDLMAQITNEEPVSPSSIVPATIEIESIILKCCRKVTDERYQSIGDLQNDLVQLPKFKA